MIPKEFIPAVEKGIRETITSGPLAGFPVVNTKAKLVFGSYHDVDSSEMAFKRAASMAFKEGFRKADPVPVSYTHLDVYKRQARRRRRRQAPPAPLQVRRQAPEGLIRTYP